MKDLSLFDRNFRGYIIDYVITKDNLIFILTSNCASVKIALKICQTCCKSELIGVTLQEGGASAGDADRPGEEL